MLEGKKSGGELVLQKETSPFGIAFVFMRRALHTGKSIWHWTPVSGSRALATSWHLSPSSESSWPVVPCPAAWEGRAGGAAKKGDPSLVCPPSLEPTVAPTASSNTVSPHAILFLLHFFLLLLLDSPSSGDDEDDDDESEDTGNLFFWDTEAFSFKEMWLPSGAAHADVHLVRQQLFLCVEIGDLRMVLWWCLSKNLEIAARVVSLL